MSAVILARDLLHFTIEQVEALPAPHVIEFEDGTRLAVRRCESIFTWYYWVRIFSSYPNVKLLPRHHVHMTLKGKDFNANTNRDLTSTILKDIVYSEQLFRPEQKEPLLDLIFKANADISYFLSRKIERYYLSLDILDFVTVARHPMIQEQREIAYQDHVRTNNTRKIQGCYDEAMRLITTLPEFKSNGLSKAVRAGMVSNNQVTQCVVFRGYVTEVDGGIFPEPVWSNYTFGNSRFSDFVTDSRTANKSYFYAESPLQDSEYTSRQFHLYVMSIERVVTGDCGNTKLFPWIVRPPVVSADGVVTYKGDLNYMHGKHYRLSPDGEVFAITGDDPALYGKTIFLRSVIHCQSKDPHTVCSACVGEMSHNISRFVNIGHLSTTTLTKEITQSILSIKHVNTSSTATLVLLDDFQRRFFNAGRKGDSYYLNDYILRANPKLTVARNEAEGLVDLINNLEEKDINPSRISRINKVKLSLNEKGHHIDELIDVDQRGTSVQLTLEFLIYLKRHGWTVDVNNDFVFDLSQWNCKHPLLSLPRLEFSFVDLGRQVKSTIKSSQDKIKQTQSTGSPEVLIQEIFDQVNAKLNINFLCFEIAALGRMVASSTSYALPRGAMAPVLTTVEQLIKNRSESAALSFQEQATSITNPAFFFKGYRPDFPMDVFYAPRQVVAAKNRSLVPMVY